MAVFQEEFYISTSERRELIDITERVEAVVGRSKIQSGICSVSAVHATAAIIVNENEDGLVQDILEKIEKDFPADAAYNHNRIDSNADAHLASAYIGQTKALPVKDGSLLRGTWQNIFLLELDGPKGERRIVVTVIGE
jgi:secondary thiamine-phosphate synthase enzyme